jgi:hypothetical protein
MENDIDLALAIPVTEYSRSVIDVVMNWLTGQTEQKSKEDVQYNKLIFNDDQIGVLSTFAECIAYFTTEENPDTDAANWDPAKIAQMIYPSPSYILCVYPEDQIGNVEYNDENEATTKLDVDGVEVEITPKKENLTYTRVYLIQDILDSIIEAEKETQIEETETSNGLQ